LNNLGQPPVYPYFSPKNKDKQVTVPKPITDRLLFKNFVLTLKDVCVIFHFSDGADYSDEGKDVKQTKPK